MAPTGIALIGSGLFAQESHLPAIQACSALELKAIYSRSLVSAKNLAAEAGAIDLYSSDQEDKGYDELLKREDIVGVIVALPIPVQPTYIKRALSAGKHVLAEKPIAKDIATATDLISFSKSISSGATLAIAENFRFLPSFAHAATTLSTLGRLLSFRVRVHSLIQPGAKYYETAWRKKPSYQGGFLLDGGVHFLAATRLVLEGSGVKPVRTSAFSGQLQVHLPPVDTVDAVVQTSNGASGTVSLSFGTTFSGSEYAFAAEKGTVTVTRGKVTVTRDGKEEVTEFPDEGNGVKAEVARWAETLGGETPDPRQDAEEALRDLQFLEVMLRSGESGGAPVELEL